MNTHRFLRRPLLALVFALAACGGESVEEGQGAMQATPPTGDHAQEVLEPAQPRMEDGVQVVEIEAGPMGYRPSAVALEAGVPARLVFTRTVDSACSERVKIPAFGVPETELPMNEPVAVEFTPTESGAFEFVCGMEMQRGSIMIRS